LRNDTTNEWKLYQAGIDYNHKIDLNTTVDTNEAFYAGDQWQGVVSNGLPKPVFNIIKRCINHFIASIMSYATKMQFTPINVGSNPGDITDPALTPEEQQKILEGEIINGAAELITQHSDVLWETQKMDFLNRQALLDAALSGDGCFHWFWNKDIDNGQEAEGNIEGELVDNTNVFFGNPNDYRVQKQPYIILSFRQLVADLKAEAKKYKVSKDDIALILSDNDTSGQSGDMSKIELEGNNDEVGKCTAIIKYWRDRDTGNICFTKSTKTVTIRDKVETKQKRYPIAMMNWDHRKNSYHGQAVCTGIIPNQIFINKMFAMVMINLMNTAFPKPVYDSSIIKQWSNQIGEAIAVKGGQDVRNVATYLQPGQMSSQIMNVIDAAINYTKELLGATDAGLGEVRPENHAALVAVQQASAIPLELVKANSYQLTEDNGLIWLDMMGAYYGMREVEINVNGQRQMAQFNFDLLQEMKLKLKIDVGPSSYWSEVASAATLDNLLMQDKITFLQYCERQPKGHIPKVDQLMEEVKAQIAKQEAEQEAMKQQAMMVAKRNAEAGAPPSGAPPTQPSSTP
jgi:hypothetical protein